MMCNFGNAGLAFRRLGSREIEAWILLRRCCVTMEHFSTASTAMKRCARTCLANDNCHPRGVIIGTGIVSSNG